MISISQISRSEHANYLGSDMVAGHWSLVPCGATYSLVSYYLLFVDSNIGVSPCNFVLQLLVLHVQSIDVSENKWQQKELYKKIRAAMTKIRYDRATENTGEQKNVG